MERASFLVEVKPFVRLPWWLSERLMHLSKPQLNSSPIPAHQDGPLAPALSRRQPAKLSFPDKHIPSASRSGSRGSDMTAAGPPRWAHLLMGLALKDCGKQSPLNKVKPEARLCPTTHSFVQNSLLPGIFLKTPARFGRAPDVGHLIPALRPAQTFYLLAHYSHRPDSTSSGKVDKWLWTPRTYQVTSACRPQ